MSSRNKPGTLRRAWTRAALLSLVVLVVTLLPATSAQAATCTAADDHDGPSGFWRPGSPSGTATGMQAPLQLVKKGTVCSSNTYGFSATFIAIEPSSDPDLEIIQIGLIHKWDPATGTDQYCKWWATGTGFIHKFQCGLVDGDYFYMRIAKPPGGAFQVETCGKALHYADGCMVMASQNAGGIWSDTVGFSWYENSDGKTCLDVGMGGPGNPMNIGNPDDPVKFAGGGGVFHTVSDGTEWRDNAAPTCNHYDWNHSDVSGTYDLQALLPFDDRN
jgi:hypothetical protein